MINYYYYRYQQYYEYDYDSIMMLLIMIIKSIIDIILWGHYDYQHRLLTMTITMMLDYHYDKTCNFPLDLAKSLSAMIIMTIYF